MDSNYSNSAGTSQEPVNGKATPTTESDLAKKEKSNSNSKREAGPSTSTNKESKTKRRRDINEQRSRHSHSKHSALDTPSTTYVRHRHREIEHIKKEKKKEERKMLDNTNANIPFAESETNRLYHDHNDSPFSFHKNPIQDEEKSDPIQVIKLADNETATKMNENTITAEDIDTYKEEVESKAEVEDKKDIENQEDLKDIKDLEVHLVEDNAKNLKENDTEDKKDKALEEEEDFWELAKVAYGLKKGAIYEENEEDSTEVTATTETDSRTPSRKKAMGGWGIAPQTEPEPQTPKPNKKKQKSQKPLHRSFSWLLGPSSDEVVLDSIALFRQMRNLLQNPTGLKQPKKQGP